MTRPIAPDRMSFERARVHLGLARWQMRQAARTGLLARTGGTFATAAVEQALVDPTFRVRLAAEDWLVSQQAAEVLGISLGRFRTAVADGVFIPVGSRRWLYGPVPFYRSADIEAGRSRYDAWAAARAAAPRIPPPAALSLWRRRQRVGSGACADRARRDLQNHQAFRPGGRFFRRPAFPFHGPRPG